MDASRIKDPKIIGIGIFILFLLLGILGLGFFRDNSGPSSPPVPTVSAGDPTIYPTSRPMKMETFYLTPTPTP